MYQFIHIETYARQASTKQKPTKAKAGAKAEAKVKIKQNVSGVIAEAIRAEGNCPHVADPKPPRYIVGDDSVMQGMQAEIEQNLEEHHKRIGGRKIRADAHVLLAGVASFPRDLQKSEPETYAKWESKTVGWLQKKYGDNLKAVLMHDDEDHPHIHFYVYSAEKVNAKELHDGYVAAAKFPPITKEAGIAHANAMREMQSAYYAEVAHDCGLLRDGPKRKRMDRATYKAIQREERERVALGSEVAQVRADLLNGAAIEAKKATELRREAEKAKEALTIARGDMDFYRQELLHARQGLAMEQARLKERRDTLHREGIALKSREEKTARAEKELAAAKAGLAAHALAMQIKNPPPKLDYQRKAVLDLFESDPAFAALVVEAAGSDSVRAALLAIANEDENTMTQGGTPPGQASAAYTKGLEQQTPAQGVSTELVIT